MTHHETCGHGYNRRQDCERCDRLDAQHRFDGALRTLRAGGFVQRASWGGDAFIGLVETWDAKVMDEAEREGVFAHQGSAFIAISRPDGSCRPWTPDAADLLACDWRSYTRRRVS